MVSYRIAGLWWVLDGSLYSGVVHGHHGLWRDIGAGSALCLLLALSKDLLVHVLEAELCQADLGWEFGQLIVGCCAMRVFTICRSRLLRRIPFFNYQGA